jgi:hypothetical protein
LISHAITNELFGKIEQSMTTMPRERAAVRRYLDRAQATMRRHLGGAAHKSARYKLSAMRPGRRPQVYVIKPRKKEDARSFSFSYWYAPDAPVRCGLVHAAAL